MMKTLTALALALSLALSASADDEKKPETEDPTFKQHVAQLAERRKNVAEHLQEISVTIQAQNSEGSGVIVTREVEGEAVNFVWTAAHVVDGLRRTRKVVDPGTGTERTVVEFQDAAILREIVQDGRRVGEIRMEARVIRYSDADDGHDLALLMVRKRDFNDDSATFFLDKEIPAIGTSLYHVGSLLGQQGSNSMTSGVMSQIGRIIGKYEFDQTTVTAFPGSSGGGVYLEDGRYIGMLVRGAGEGFNLIVPVRRIRDWASDAGVLWALDPGVDTPSFAEIEKLSVEDIGVSFKPKGGAKKVQGRDAGFGVWFTRGDHETEHKGFPFLIKRQQEAPSASQEPLRGTLYYEFR